MEISDWLIFTLSEREMVSSLPNRLASGETDGAYFNPVMRMAFKIIVGT